MSYHGVGQDIDLSQRTGLPLPLPSCINAADKAEAQDLCARQPVRGYNGLGLSSSLAELDPCVVARLPVCGKKITLRSYQRPTDETIDEGEEGESGTRRGMMVGGILLALVVVGGGTLYYVTRRKKAA